MHLREFSHMEMYEYCLGGVMVKASALREEDRGWIPGRVMPKTLKMEF